jgi:murein DD-endopeptidase MepM/ murein hydrolase activator NlpD
MIRFLRWLFSPRYRLLKLLFAAAMLLLFFWFTSQTLQFVRDLRDPRSQGISQWLQGDTAEREELVTAQRDICAGAQFILPADGYIGLLYADPRGPYSQSSPHQGIDIFSNADPGVVPVYAAYDGYVRREADWKSTLIMRVPDDPLQPGRQIWLYYTHMADEAGNDFILDAFPPGTVEKFVSQGTLLGYTGNYNGNSLRDVWVHLHFSIVKDDGSGIYSNELDFDNTIDPSAYLGIPVNYHCGVENSGCSADPSCEAADSGS